MRSDETARKNAVPSEGQCGNSGPGGRHHECQVCEQDADRTPGAGVCQIWSGSFHEDHGKLDHPMRGPVSAAALRPDERRAAPG